MVLLAGVLLLLMVDGCFRFTVTTHAKTMFAPVVSFCWWLVVMHLLFFIGKWNDVGQEAFSFLESFIYKGSYDGWQMSRSSGRKFWIIKQMSRRMGRRATVWTMMTQTVTCPEHRFS